MSRGWYPDAATTRMQLAAADLGFDIHSWDTTRDDMRAVRREAGIEVPDGQASSRDTDSEWEPSS
ncbi:hypothetical protein VHN57_10140 [Sphingobium sp. WW5]|uniref:hypothetical protein n=1 Tax=unclassified Sphingobium TaxID=2611147 RepID=UPI00065C94C4